jgi:O-antigen/teichoic acid export membrane protein/serine acetyltransferase
MNKNGIFAHTFYVLLNRLALPLGAFFLLVVIARYSNRLLGEYALVTTYFYVMQTLPLLGLTPFVMREVARNPSQSADYFISIGFLCLISSLLVILTVQFGISFSGYDEHVKEAIKVVGYTIIPGILVFTAEIILTSLHKTSPISVVAIFENITRVLVSISLLSQGYGLVSLIWTLFVTRSLSLGIYLVIVYKTSPSSLLRLPNFAILKKALGATPPFLLAMVLTLGMSRLDFFVLSVFQTLDSIGHYAVAYRMYEIGQLFVAAFLTAIFPTIAKQYLGTRSHLIVAIRNFLVFVGAALVPITLGGLFIADNYVKYLFPNQYPESVLLTQLFMLLFLLGGLDQSASAVLNAIDAQKHDARAALFGLSLYALSLFVLVIPYGVYGAFAASCAAISAEFFIRLKSINRILPILPKTNELLRLIIVLVLFIYLTLLWWGKPLWSELLAVIVMATLILPAMLALGGIFQPLRLVRYFRKPNYPVDVKSCTNLLDTIIADKRREKVYRRRWKNMGSVAVTMYRISRYFYLSGHTGVAQLFRIFNSIITKSEIKPSVFIGPGLVLISASGVVVSSDAGRNVSFMAWSGIGKSGNNDIGAGIGIPVTGDNVLFKQRCAVLGAHMIPSGKTFKPCAKVRSHKDLLDAFEN